MTAAHVRSLSFDSPIASPIGAHRRGVGLVIAYTVASAHYQMLELAFTRAASPCCLLKQADKHESSTASLLTGLFSAHLFDPTATRTIVYLTTVEKLSIA